MARKRQRNRGKGKTMVGPPVANPMQGMMGQGAAPMGMAPSPEVPTDGAEPEEGEEGPESNVSPEEQALYHKFMENYYTVMYVKGQEKGPQGEPPLVEQVQNFFVEIPNPIDALANAAVTVISFLSDSAEAAGKPIPGDVLMHAGTEVISDLAELAENAGHHEYTEDEIGGALTKGMMLYKDLNAGKINMDEIKGDYEMMVAADKEGRLDDIIPGASKAAEKLPQPEPEEELPPEAQTPMPPQQPMPAPAGAAQRGFGRA